MKRILGLLCIMAIIATSMISTAVVSLAETPSSAMATDVYASGNWTVGQTVTANYTYFDPAGKPQVGDAVVEWWRTGKLIKTDDEVKVSDSPSYTITDKDTDGLYFTVTVANEDGMGAVFYSPVYVSDVADSSETKPVKKKLHIILADGARSYAPGATVRAVHNTSFANGKSEGETSYMWRVKDTRSAKYTVRAHTQLYTITEEDYGKWLECAVTVKDESGASSDQLTSMIYVGNKLDFDASIKVDKTYNSKPNLINRLWYQPADNIYCYIGSDVSVTIDAAKYIKFDGFNLSIDNVASDLKIAYSKDSITWEEFSGTDTYNGNFTTVFDTNDVKIARYFKVSYKGNGSNYSIIEEAYPVLSATNKGAEYADIASVGCGAVVDNVNLTISNIQYGTPLKSLADSIVTVNDACKVSVIDEANEDVTDNIRSTPENASNYRIKVTYGESSLIYTLVFADALKTIDLSKVVNERYTAESVKNTSNTNESTGYTANIPGAKTTYWHSSAKYTNSAKETAELYPYGTREIIDGEDVLKVCANGNTGGLVDIWYTASGLDEEGCYSFSFKVKPGYGSSIQVYGRPYNNISTVEFVGSFVKLDTEGVHAHNGTGLIRKGDFVKEKWYDVEVVVDYKNMKKSVWVNGENYIDGAELEFSSKTYNKSYCSMDIKISATENGKDDINYIKDIKFDRVWDVRSRATANSDSVGMKLYSGDSVVNKLEPGTYSAVSYGDLICDKFYVAVYKVEYSDSSKSVQTACYPLKVYGTDGSLNAQINDIVVPKDAYSETSDARIMIFCWNNVADPACNFVQID